MRRIVLSGLGIALGVAARPVVAQQATGRAVTFGRPIMVADTPAAPPLRALPDPGVTPAGLFSRSGESASTSRQYPSPSGVVPSPGQMMPFTTGGVPVLPGTSSPYPFDGYPMGMGGMGTAATVPTTGPSVVFPTGTAQGFPTPQPLGTPGGPRVTETRDGNGVKLPAGPGVAMGAPVPLGTAVVVSPVGPDGGVPFPQLDSPAFGDGCLPPGQVSGGLFDGEWYRRGLLGRALVGDPGRNPRWWVTGEYLMWWTKSTNLPPLATTTTVPGSDAFLGAPGTSTILGGGRAGDLFHSGARFGAGWWFNDDQRRGVDFRYFFLGSSADSATVASGTLTRPFVNLNAGIPFGETVASPGFSTGAVNADLKNSMWGAEANYRRFLAGDACARLDALAGFRYLHFDERLAVSETFSRTSPAGVSIGLPGVVSGTVTDRFRTTNDFYGGQFGLTGEIRRNRWFVNGRTTVALGTVRQSADIAGAQTLTFANGATGQFPGGLLAVPGANIGQYHQNKFAVLPEVGVNVGYHVTPHFRVFVGYNFMYLSSVLRPGDAIDPGLDVARIPNFPLTPGATFLPGTPRPTPMMRTSDFFAQGVNFGAGWSW